MQAVLFSKTGEFSGTSFKITQDVSIGKSNTNDIQLRSGIISGSHARITLDKEENAFYIEDLGSSNGTQLDGLKIGKKEKLEWLHVITFAGKHDFIFQVGGVAPTKTERPPEPSKSAKKQDPRLAKPASDQKTIVEQGGQQLPSFGKKVEPAGEKTIVDSGQGAQSGLPSFGKKPKPDKPQTDDKEKTMIESGKGGALPSFDKPKEEPKLEAKPEAKPEVKEEEKTMIDKPAASGLPQFQKKDKEEPPPPSQEATAAMGSSSVPEPTIPTPQPSEKAKYVVRIEKLNKEFELTSGANTIGRVFGNDIIIEDSSMSRKHASIIVAGEKLSITDLGSRNGTFVNKNRINSEVDINTDSELKLGLVEMKITKEN